MSVKIKAMYHFENKNVAVFDMKGEQVPELQGAFDSTGEWVEFAEGLNYDISEASINGNMVWTYRSAGAEARMNDD